MLTVQVGQCGNQLGRALFDALATDTVDPEDPTESTESAFFREVPGRAGSPATRRARAVLVDTEPRVIQRCFAPHSGAGSESESSASGPARWTYERGNVFTQQSGSGNNWAHGYAGHGARHAEALLELLRVEAERCDLLQGVLMLQSVAGGTGSGLGSHLAECVADAFPAPLKLNAVVWPHDAGEVIVQHYNAVLTMARLAEASDGLLVLENDVARAMCQRLLRLPRPSFDAMNGVLAAHLASALLPLAGGEDPMQSMAEILCCHPGFKLLDIKMIPQMPPRSKAFSTHTWAGLLKHLHQMQVTQTPLEEGIDWHATLATRQAVGSLLLLRGASIQTADVSAFRHPTLYAPWHAAPFACLRSSTRFHGNDKTATLVSNSKALLPTLSSTVERAHHMFEHGAYTHQYQRHGVDDAFFQTAFLRVDQIVRNYQTL